MWSASSSNRVRTYPGRRGGEGEMRRRSGVAGEAVGSIVEVTEKRGEPYIV